METVELGILIQQSLIILAQNKIFTTYFEQKKSSSKFTTAFFDFLKYFFRKYKPRLHKERPLLL